MKHELCCIGHITLDKVVTPGNTVYMPGGTSFYVSHALKRFDDLDYALRIKGVQHYDEYEKAKKWINRAVGKDVTLVRGELNFLKAEDIKKK